MRSFQVMRCGRRGILTANELTQSINHSNTSTPTYKTRSLTFSFDQTQRSFDETDESTTINK
mgnify:FL=1